MRGILVAGLMLGLTALGGCTGDPEPRFGEPSQTPSASESTTSAAAEKEPWEKKSKAGAVAFARHWIDVFNEAQQTGETSSLQASSTETCVSCRDLAMQLEGIYSGGGSLTSNGWRVVNAAASPGPIADGAEVVLRIDRSPQRVTNGDGKVQRFPGGSATFSVGLVWDKETWLVDELVRL